MLAKRLGVPVGTLNNVLGGFRRPTLRLLNDLVELWHEDQEEIDRDLAKFIEGYQLESAVAPMRNRPGVRTMPVSRTHRLNLGRGALRIGVLDYSPWGRPGQAEHLRPDGLVPDLLAVMAASIGIECQWRMLRLAHLEDAVVAGEVDLAAGFICRTPRRTVRTVFVPLDLPVELGIQAITRISPEGADYFERKEWLEREIVAKRMELVMAEGEMAWDYRQSILSERVVPLITTIPKAEILETTERYWDKEGVVIMTDHVTADQFVLKSKKAGEAKRFRKIFHRKLGSFGGGFLLPDNDEEFLKFFRASYSHLIHSRLPIIGELLNKYARELVPFMRATIRVLALPSDSPWQDRQRHLAGTITEWVLENWPVEVPVPKEMTKLMRTEGKLIDRHYREELYDARNFMKALLLIGAMLPAAAFSAPAQGQSDVH